MTDPLPPRPRGEPERPNVADWVWFVVGLVCLALVLFLIAAICTGGN